MSVSLYDDLFQLPTNYEFNEILPLNSLNSYPAGSFQPSEEGKALLEPFLPVIGAAHRGELPPVVLAWSRAGELNAYTCALSAEIWYGIGLDDARLSDRLENLRRLQEWYTETQK